MDLLLSINKTLWSLRDVVALNNIFGMKIGKWKMKVTLKLNSNLFI